MSLLSPRRRSLPPDSTADASIVPSRGPLSQSGHGGSGPHRRGLVRMAVRDTLHLCGVPADWIAAHVLMVRERDGDSHAHVRLALQHWDERLLKYLPLIEQRVRAEVIHFEPDASHWLRSFSWEFPANDYPHEAMPAASTWAAATVPEARPSEFAPTDFAPTQLTRIPAPGNPGADPAEEWAATRPRGSHA